MSLSSSSFPPENSINFSIVYSSWVSRMILISWPRLEEGEQRSILDAVVELQIFGGGGKGENKTYHFTAWFLTSDILSSTKARTCLSTLFSIASSPVKEAGSCLISDIKSFRPINLFVRSTRQNREMR